MPGQVSLNPLVLVKFGLWIVTLVVATVLLRRGRVTRGVRLAFLVGGVLVFGFLFGALIPGGLNPNPVASLRTLLTSLLVHGQLVPMVAVMLGIMLLAVLISNKSICGWGCQLGLLQDLLHRVPVAKWKPPFWLANGVRAAAFLALVAGLVLGGLDWIGVIDPFSLFSFDLSLWMGLFAGGVLVASLFVYRPWCQFLCPFGLVGWVVEQFSVLRPRIDRDVCVRCQRCVKACPSQAMSTILAGSQIHADCFACGACIEACPKEGALGWRGRSKAKSRG